MKSLLGLLQTPSQRNVLLRVCCRQAQWYSTGAPPQTGKMAPLSPKASPKCINALIRLNDAEMLKKEDVLQCVTNYTKLPSFQQWDYQTSFMSLMNGCLLKLDKTSVLTASEISNLVKCAQLFAVAPNHPDFVQYFDTLRNKFDILLPYERTLSSQDLVNIMIGLSASSSKNEAMLKFMELISPVVASWEGTLQGREAAACIQGLRGLDGSEAQAPAFLAAVTRHIKHADWFIGPSYIGLLCGFQRMSDRVPEVKDLYEFVASKILQESTHPMDSRAVSTALTGLLNKDCSNPITNSLVYLFIDEINGIIEDPYYNPGAVSAIQRAAVMVLPKLKGTSESTQKAIENVINRLHAENERIRTLNAINKTEMKFRQSDLEARAIERVKKRIQLDGRIALSNNEYLLGFECDIVFRIPDIVSVKSSDPAVKKQLNSVLVDVEIDGPHHKSANKSFLDELRDDYMYQQGVIVVRLGSVSIEDMTVGNILTHAVKKHPHLWPQLEQFVPEKSDFGNSFKKGRMSRRKNVRFIRGPEDLA